MARELHCLLGKWKGQFEPRRTELTWNALFGKLKNEGYDPQEH